VEADLIDQAREMRAIDCRTIDRVDHRGIVQGVGVVGSPCTESDSSYFLFFSLRECLR